MSLCCVTSLLGSPTEIVSLAYIRCLLNRKKVDKDAKKFQPSDEFLQNVSQSYLVASLTHFLEMESPDQVTPSAGKELSLQWLQDKAHEFVVKMVAVPRHTSQRDTDHVYNRHRNSFHAALILGTSNFNKT